MLGGGTQKCDRVPLLVMEGLGAGAPGARGTPKRPREEEEDPRQQEWEEELRQQAAAGWPELTCEIVVMIELELGAAACLPALPHGPSAA